MVAKQRLAIRLGNAEITPRRHNPTDHSTNSCPGFHRYHGGGMYFRAGFVFLLMGFLVASRAGATSLPDRISVGPMKTSIYVGSVKLTTPAFKRDGVTLSTTYDARVTPWFFWNESGQITITLSESDFEALAKGQTVEFKGEGKNQKNKPRTITGRAQPTDEKSGKIKVRVKADGVELIFNGTYHFE